MPSANHQHQSIFQSPSFYFGLLFLVAYWLIGFDGITFSDDVYYILAGKSFWQGTMELDSYHFSSRWGAYVPFGFFGHLFGFHPRIFSIFSLLCYGLTFTLLFQYFSSSSQSWLFTLWFCSQVYFLHFISKVYPDSALVLWVSLVPIASIYRHKNPILAAFGLVAALFLGFITKETIIFLAPFPILLFILDWKKKRLNLQFYSALIASGLLFGCLYLGFFWYKFGDPLYRIQSINAGHYISEFTYADKGWTSILKRLTILPFTTFVERAYWPWIVLSIPGILFGLKAKKVGGQEFALALICLILGFWLMSSTLEFYNPIYLNPRHLIILVPILSFCLVKGIPFWIDSTKWKRFIAGLFILGSLIGLLLLDWKMAVFNAAFIPLIYIQKPKIRIALLAGILLVPALIAIPYQHTLKKYDNLLETLEELTNTKDQSLIITNNFLIFSKEILLPEKKDQQNLLLPIEEIKTLQRFPPSEVRVMIYEYYAHAYPKEQEDVNRLELWIQINGYEIIEEYREDRIWYRKLSRKID